MKKVLIFSLAYLPYVSGAELAVKEVTDRIGPGTLQFHLVTLRFSRSLPREERLGNVVVHRIGGGSSRLAKFLFQFYAALAGIRLCRRERFNATWAIMAHSAGVPAALFKLWHPSIPMLLTLQEGDPPRYIERTMLPLWPLFARAFTHASAVQAISTFLGNWARQRHFTGRLEIIPNGVDVAGFARVPTPEALAAARAAIGKKAGETWLIHTGRFVHKNGLESVVDALPLLPEHVHFFAIGEGPDKAALAARALERGMAHRLHLHTGVPLNELPAYLHACDIFIRPSRSEGMGNSFIEAMAAGLPVIATQEGGIKDFVFDAARDPGKAPTGFAVDTNAPAQIAEHVQYILAHPGETARTVDNAKKLVAEKYDWGTIARQMEALLLRVCASS